MFMQSTEQKSNLPGRLRCGTGSLWIAGGNCALLALFDLLGAFFSWDEKHEKQLIFFFFLFPNPFQKPPFSTQKR